MGCASSKSTPVVESSSGNDEEVAEGQHTFGENAIRKGSQVVRNLTHEINEAATDLSHKVGSFMHGSDSKPSTPETERAQLPESTDDSTESADTDEAEDDETAPKPMRIISIDVDEDNQDELAENQIPVKVSLSIDNPDDNSVGSDKPPTPMPEAVINNAIWPQTISESNERPPKSSEEVVRSTPLDPIEEEKRFVNLPSDEGAAMIEILTIEITEIPIVPDGADEETTKNDENKETEEDKEKEEAEAE